MVELEGCGEMLRLINSSERMVIQGENMEFQQSCKPGELPETGGRAYSASSGGGSVDRVVGVAGRDFW